MMNADAYKRIQTGQDLLRSEYWPWLVAEISQRKDEWIGLQGRGQYEDAMLAAKCSALNDLTEHILSFTTATVTDESEAALGPKTSPATAVISRIPQPIS